MLNINPIKTKSWKDLKKHFIYIKNYKIYDLFKKDCNRFNEFSFNFKNKIIFDYSKNNICKETIYLFINLLKEINFKKFVNLMLLGERINFSENKSVLHIHSRDYKNIFFSNKNNLSKVYNDFKINLNKIKLFTNIINDGKWLGFSNKKIINIVNLGIGGSDIGPKMVVKSLKKFKKSNINIYFISNIDGTIEEILNKLSPEETLFIICSKSYTTIETIVNSKIARKWILDYFDNNFSSISNHFIGISNNYSELINFGIDKDNVFDIPDYIGGRYSLFSSVGLIISLSVGYKNFLSLLNGAHDMDVHFINSNYSNNIPIILAFISIWYNNFFNYESESVLVYNNNLSLFPLYLQQLVMESNGKNIDRNGNYIYDYNTSPVIFGGIGTDVQHSFFQFLHQGTKIIPCDFIAEILNDNNSDSYTIHMSNFFAQTQALAFGDKIINLNSNNIVNKYKRFSGNRPSNTFLLKKIDPYTLGALISLYEHKVFTQGIILNIFSFDQWGVELGKKLSVSIHNLLNIDNIDLSKNKLDSSTFNLINYFNKYYFNK